MSDQRTPSAPASIQDWLRVHFPDAKQLTLRRMLQAGRVQVNGSIARRMKLPLAPDDRIEVRSPAPALHKPVAPTLHPLQVVFEDEDVLVVNKPAGLLSSTVPREPRPTALALVRACLAVHDPRARVGLIHRLDRDASGLLVFSKNDIAYRALKQQFFDHSVRRVYTAITHGTPTPPQGRIESRLVELPDGSVRSSQRPRAGERAVTEYQTIIQHGGRAALRVTLQTGRKHQIRAHLSERGVPIVGDRVYAGTGNVRASDDAPRLMLAATLLEFRHPRTSEIMRFELNVPKEFPLLGGKPLSS